MANEKGTFSNPYTYEEYQNISTKGKWNGGHVLYNGKIYYYNSNGILSSDDCDGCGSGSSSGCGCGCGCGSGCGCGCGCGAGIGTGALLAGEIIFRPDVFKVNTYFNISWEEGTFLHGGQPPLFVELVNGDKMDIFNVHSSWENAYRIIITFKIVLPGNSTADHCVYDYSIPNYYRR